MNKIVAVVKMNNHEAYVLEEPVNFIYTKHGKDTIIGTDGCFLMCYGYETPSKGWEAFAGRKFDLPLSDGTVEHCCGQWWMGVNNRAKEVVGEEIISVAQEDIKRLKECYIFAGCCGIKNKVEQLRSEYSGKVYEYNEYRNLLRGELCSNVNI